MPIYVTATHPEGIRANNWSDLVYLYKGEIEADGEQVTGFRPHSKVPANSRLELGSLPSCPGLLSGGHRSSRA